MSKGISRKQFLGMAAIGGLAGIGIPLYLKRKKDLPPLSWHDSLDKHGHLLRNAQVASLPSEQHAELLENIYPVIIVGAGIAGLSAARQLKQKGIPFLLLELSDEIGGNAIGGEIQGARHPWGAHYLPVPNLNQPELIQFLSECGVIESIDAQGKPVYNDAYLCAEPEERLYLKNYWQEGLIPEMGLTEDDHHQIKRFLQHMEECRQATGADGKEAFCIPVQESSEDKRWTKLDDISFTEYLTSMQFTSKPLLWYLNYCCKDDYGIPAQKTSAWAGIHYFAARKGIASNAASDDVLTWPEGNQFLVRQLEKGLENSIKKNILVRQIEEYNNSYVIIQATHTSSGQTLNLAAKQVILATPQYIGKRIFKQYPLPAISWNYQPWLIANIHCKALQHEKGMALCWDNVLYSSESLGYVNAAHQLLQGNIQEHVLTYYLPLCNKEAAAARKDAREVKAEEWAERILADLEVAHPDIRQNVNSMVLKLWGHAMIAPEPGIITAEDKKVLLNTGGRVHFAHSDLSGISIFEEAFYHGNRAARAAINALKV